MVLICNTDVSSIALFVKTLKGEIYIIMLCDELSDIQYVSETWLMEVEHEMKLDGSGMSVCVTCSGRRCLRQRQFWRCSALPHS